MQDLFKVFAQSNGLNMFFHTTSCERKFAVDVDCVGEF